MKDTEVSDSPRPARRSPHRNDNLYLHDPAANGEGERGGGGLKLGVGEVGEGARLGQQLLVEDAAEGEHRQPAVLDLLELPHVERSVCVSVFIY